ncbi:MAG: SUMF1/EgtB/PvdO family nonheme iron enzyme [Polyangiaceae bacterium]|nr:SUMF1/EgtB/PvdO family nonheme iron enzyme [Polyangiaceae bacterium]
MRWSAAIALLALGGCEGRRTGGAPSASASAVVDAPELPASPPKGMVLIPGGVLLAGTPEGKVPRAPDRELPGAQVVMKPFFIDELPYPNEPGAIPRTGVTLAEAQAVCEAQQKRLCSELEWERACKGPDNAAYPYGERYQQAACHTGNVPPAVPPVGISPGCRSRFGVRDTHGTVWEWTDSPFGRGSTDAAEVALRGGNSPDGDVVGRCANVERARATEARPDRGFRCCFGPRNLAEVTLDVVRGEVLRSVSIDPALEAALLAAPPNDLSDAMVSRAAERFKVAHAWRWRPVGNEELVLQSGCAHPRPGGHAACGVAIGRQGAAALAPVGFASSSWWLPTLHQEGPTSELWVIGGDELGAFRRRVRYASGRVVIGDPEYKSAEGRKKKKRKKATE